MIYIDMDMPKGCVNCPLNYDATCKLIPFCLPDETNGSKRRQDCPLIPVPDHGRLVDADAFIKDECNFCDGACEALPCDCLNCNADCRCDFMLHLLDAPTIIPADPAEEGET